MSKRLPVPGLLSYADLMGLLSCSRSTVSRMVKKGILPAPHDIEGLGPRWWEDEIIVYLASLRVKKRVPKSPEN